MIRTVSYLLIALAGANALAENYALDVIEYARLTGSERREYIGGVREAYARYEGAEASQPDYYAALALLPRAVAAAPATCPVGGVIRNKVNGKCPTGGRNCDGKSDGFKCGRLYGSACLDRQPVDTLSARCAAAGQTDVSSEEYAKIMPILNVAAADSCRKGTSAQCDQMLAKMKDLYTKYRRPAVAQEKTAAPIEPVSLDKNGVCGPPAKADRVQAEHACVACALDYAVAKENPRSKIPFKTSANWLNFLSGVQKACDTSDIETPAWKKVDASPASLADELNLVATFGACSESSFTHHQAFEQYEPGQTHPEDGSRVSGRDGAMNLVGRVAYEEEKFKAASSKGGWTAPDRNHPDALFKRYGITMRQAYDLFCPDTKSLKAAAGGFEARLEKNKANYSPEFRKCAQEALANRKRLKFNAQRECKSQDVAGGAKVAEALRAALKTANAPLPITIKDGSGSRCAVVTGFDQQGFKMVSGGVAEMKTNDEIAKVAISTIEPSCPVVSRSVVREAERNRPALPVQPASSAL